MNRSQWTSEEIDYLTMAYFSGNRIKVIANNINRSEMAINKALRRFNIRPQDEQKEASKKLKESKEVKSSKPSQKRIRESHKKLGNDWITIPKMINWMIESGINVVPIDKFKLKYKINHIPFTLGQLLLNCNRFRLANNLPIFRVKGITNV